MRWRFVFQPSITITLVAAARKLAIYKLDLLDVQEIRWDERDKERAGNYKFSMEKETKIN